MLSSVTDSAQVEQGRHTTAGRAKFRAIPETLVFPLALEPRPGDDRYIMDVVRCGCGRVIHGIPSLEPGEGIVASGIEATDPEHYVAHHQRVLWATLFCSRCQIYFAILAGSSA